MALVGDDEVELLDRHLGIVGDIAGAPAEGGRQLRAGEVVRLFGQLLPAQDGVEPLDRADGHPADIVDGGRGEMLDVVELREETARVGCAEAMELVAGLLAEVGAVDEEEDAAGAGVLDESVREGTGRVGLAGAGGHVDERARTVVGEGPLETGDGLDLAVAHAGGDERMGGRQSLEADP